MRKSIRLIALLLAVLFLLAACGAGTNQDAGEDDSSRSSERRHSTRSTEPPAEPEVEETPDVGAQPGVEPVPDAPQPTAVPAADPLPTLAPAPPIPTPAPTPVPTPVPTPAPTPAPLPVVTPAPTPVPTPAPTPVPTATRVQMERQDTTEREAVLIRGLDAQGSTVWTRSFNTEYRTELSLIQEIGTWQDRYYFNNNGRLTALRISDGELLWSNPDFGGASISYLLGSDGNIYICGYYGPDFYAVNSRGQTLINYRDISDNYFWPSDLRWYSDWEIEGTFYGGYDYLPEGGAKFIIDLATPSYRMAEATPPSGSPVELNLTSVERYWAAIFVSNFAEAISGTLVPSTASLKELADFVHMHLRINRPDAISFDGNTDTFSLTDANAVAQRLMGVTLNPSDGVFYEDGWGHQWRFENGKFYYPAGDGEAYNCFAVVTGGWKNPDGTYRFDFDVYELNLDEYFSTGMSADLYWLSPGEAQTAANSGRIIKIGSGTAYGWPVQIDGHQFYTLVSYSS